MNLRLHEEDALLPTLFNLELEKVRQESCANRRMEAIGKKLCWRMPMIYVFILDNPKHKITYSLSKLIKAS